MGQRKILVVDPNPAVCTLLSLVFDPTAYDVACASDGEEALGRAIVDPPDLVLTELRLDRLDGALLCEQLKRHPRTCFAKVLFLTTSTSAWDARRARRAGADAYLTKPFSPRALLRQVADLFGDAEPDSGTDWSQTADQAGS